MQSIGVLGHCRIWRAFHCHKLPSMTDPYFVFRIVSAALPRWEFVQTNYRGAQISKFFLYSILCNWCKTTLWSVSSTHSYVLIWNMPTFLKMLKNFTNFIDNWSTRVRRNFWSENKKTVFPLVVLVRHLYRQHYEFFKSLSRLQNTIILD